MALGFSRIFLLVIPIALAAVILALVGGRGVSVFKKQGVAWGLTALMVIAAIGIGNIKALASNAAEPAPDLQPGSSPALETVPPDLQQGAAAPNAAAAGYFVLDDAGVLSEDTVASLIARNARLYELYGVVIGVVTCNYDRDDLGQYAVQCADDMGLSGFDFIVVLDIRGDNYWLVQGDNLIQRFTDQMCSDYAWRYMEDSFAAGDYDRAVLDLTEMLELWYGTYYGTYFG